MENSILFPSSSTSSNTNFSSSSSNSQDVRRSKISVGKSLKEETYEEYKDRDESVWEERPLKFPARDERDVVMRKVRSVLNKISSVNYLKLRKRWLTLIPSESDLLMEVIRLIVSKAIDEPMYQCIYARLVSNALTTKPSHVASTIRENLIAYIHTLLQRLTTDMEIAKFNRSMERDLISARHRKVMLHRFIAELFLESVCSSKYIGQKMTELVGQGRKNPEDADESLECLCVLLTFAGAKLEEVRGSWLDEILVKINLREMINSPAVSKRIQFMVLDLLEMKSKGWVPHNKWWTPRVDIEVDAEDEVEAAPAARHIISATESVPRRNFNKFRQASPRQTTSLEWRVRSSRRTSDRARNIDAKAIHEILNKVVPGNAEKMVVRLSNILSKQEKALSMYCDLMLTHVSEDPIFTRVHSMLLARVSEKIPRLGKLITQKLPKFITETPNSLTGIWFLSEWYNMGLVSVREVIGIMNKFLSLPSPPIECLCAFFLMTGQRLNSSVPRGRIWMKTALRKLETLVSEHEYRLKCFVWDILDLHENNWEQLRSLNWIHQFTPSDFLTAKEEDELEPILRLLDTNYKEGIQALRSLYGTKERNMDKFAYNAIMWSLGHQDVEMLKVTGRCIRKLSGFKGLLSPDKLRMVVSELVMVTASSPDAWNMLRIVMSELYSTQ